MCIGNYRLYYKTECPYIARNYLDGHGVVYYTITMTRDKLLARMKNNPRGDWQISHVETLAKRYGFQMNRSKGGGSHVTLRHDSGPRLSIPAHRPIKPAYIRQRVQLIEHLEEDES